MITVTGVTGKLGRIVVEDLLTRLPASEVVAVVRTPDKAADLADAGRRPPRRLRRPRRRSAPPSSGADVLLLVSSPDVTPGVRPRQHGNAITAAVEAGVGRVVYTSGIHAQDGPGFLRDHGATEDLLARAGRAVHRAAQHVLRGGAGQPGPAGRRSRRASCSAPTRACRSTSPRCATSGSPPPPSLTGDGHAGAVYELRGPLWTVAELAATVADVAGAPVAYRAVDSDALGPAAFVHDLIADGLFREPSDDLAKLLGREPTSLRDAVAAALGS